MGTAERRVKIMRTLCRRRHETISNLAREFGVSPRTIQRDVQVLSLTEPIYTQCGRYGGGVYISQEYRMDRMYMTDSELSVLHKLESLAQAPTVFALEQDELFTLKHIISQYTKPKTRKENQK